MPSPTSAPQSVRHPRTPPPETVDPGWLLKAFALVVTVAAIFGYATLCLLFYQGQWQLVLHPGKQPSGPVPAGAEIVHFGPDATATPQLTGWWMPAASDARYRQLTLLYLRGADGALADDTPTLAVLHDSGVNLLAFNYRGYPETTTQRPSQERMSEDAESALQYLLADRHIAVGSIVPYGVGIGASFAVHLAAEHRDLPALVLDAPRGDLLKEALGSPEGYLLPVHLLFNQRFPLAEPVAKLATPKLILTHGPTEMAIGRQASDPKLTAELPAGLPASALQSTLSRFLDQYLPASAPSKDAPSAPKRTDPRRSR